MKYVTKQRFLGMTNFFKIRKHRNSIKSLRLFTMISTTEVINKYTPN